MQRFFAELKRLPWWFGLTAAGLFAVIGAVLIPILAPDNVFLPQLQSVAQGFMYLLAFLCLLAAIVSAARSWRQGRLFVEMGLGRRLETLTWQEFEAMLAGAFRAQGYLVMESPPGPDEGVDLRLRRSGERVYVQAKHWRGGKVGVKPIRELAGVVSAAGVDRGIVVSSSGFTDVARRFADKAGIELVGPEQLHHWFRQYSPREQSETEAGRGEAPLCMRCATPMVRRVARRGRRAGTEFWGCTNYPRCRMTRPMTQPFPGLGVGGATPRMARLYEDKEKRL